MQPQRTAHTGHTADQNLNDNGFLKWIWKTDKRAEPAEFT